MGKHWPTIWKFLDQYGFKNKIIAYVKDEGSKLNNMTFFLKYVVKCEVFGLDESFQGTCFGHVSSTTYQYVVINKKNCKNLKFVLIKSTYSNL
jgi:hypothetical protein